MSRTLFLFIVATSVVVLATNLGRAQHHQPKHGNQTSSASETFSGLFSIGVYGAFRNMMSFKDHSPKADLRTVIDAGATEAVGAVSELRGEITFVDGKPIVTYGAPCSTCSDPDGVKATLLITSRVKAWLPPVALPADLSGHDLDRFIIMQANAAGLDMTKPFPVRITGKLKNVAMHVIKSVNPHFGGHGSGQPMALQEDIKADSIEGHVIGFYAPEPMLGIITHPGEPFHYHWVNMNRTRTAHLDAFGMAKGARLLLPMR